MKRMRDNFFNKPGDHVRNSHIRKKGMPHGVVERYKVITAHPSSPQHEEEEQFLAMLSFEQKQKTEKLSNALK